MYWGLCLICSGYLWQVSKRLLLLPSYHLYHAKFLFCSYCLCFMKTHRLGTMVLSEEAQWPFSFFALWHQGLQSPQQVPPELMSHSIKSQKEVAEETPAELISAEVQQNNLSELKYRISFLILNPGPIKNIHFHYKNEKNDLWWHLQKYRYERGVKFI